MQKKLQLVDPNTSLIPSVYKVTVDNIINYRADINTHPSILDALSHHYTLAKENKITWLMAENLAIAFMLQVYIIKIYKQKRVLIDQGKLCS